jgi:cytochrome c-type biogenesis protein CcmH
MNVRKKTGWLLVFCLLSFAALAQGGPAGQEPAPAPAVELNAQQSEVARGIKSQIMAPCCWHGTVDHHNSPIATDIANRIDGWVAGGEGEDAIYDKLVAEFGERILARPRASGLGLMFYVGPAVATILAGLALNAWLKRQVRPQAAGMAQEARVPAADSDWNRRFEDQLKRLD